MKPIELNSQGEAVQEFFLSLPVDADGSLIELNGQAVARVFAIGKRATAPGCIQGPGRRPRTNADAS